MTQQHQAVTRSQPQAAAPAVRAAVPAGAGPAATAASAGLLMAAGLGRAALPGGRGAGGPAAASDPPANRQPGHPHTSAQSLLALQRRHGNLYVARLLDRSADAVKGAGILVQRDCAPAAPARPPQAPLQDPDFVASKRQVEQQARLRGQHTPAPLKTSQTQAAAKGPPNDVASQAKQAQIGKMAQQKPGDFDKAAFVAAVKKAVEAAAPKNFDEADNYQESGKAGQVKGQIGGLVGQHKDGAVQPIKAATTETPDAGQARPKVAVAAPPEAAVPPPGPVGAAQAMPDPKPPAEVDLRQGACETDERMKEAKVTTGQLEHSNEPQFQAAARDKQQADAQTREAPAQFRAQEQKVIGGAKAQAGMVAAQGLGGMHAGRSAAVGKVGSRQQRAQAADEAARADVAAGLEAIYAATQGEVKQILDGIDAKIDPVFDSGEQANREALEAEVEADTEMFKSNRSTVEWIEDKFSAPPELDRIVDRAVKRYLQHMDRLIDRIADIVAVELTRAKTRIARGQQDAALHVAHLSKSQREIGKEMLGEFGDRFKELVGLVDERRDAIVDGLAEKYVAARDAVNERATAMKEANKGVWDRVKDAVGAAIDTILKLKDMLLGVLARAAGVIDKIIDDPIAFLGNLVGAIKQGLNLFVGNIGTHLKNGLTGWLFGTLAAGGIQLPEKFDLRGIVGLVAQIAGLSYANIRARAVGIVGDKAVGVMEKSVGIFQTLAKEGLGGVWTFIVDKVGSLKDVVLEQIQDFVVTKVITAGVTWLLSMLNPASAFIRACKMIYDVVMFFVERGSQIMSLVDAVISGVGDIASGVLGAAAKKVEDALGQALPLAISFLASLLGLGGIAEKIKSILKAIQAPINKAIDAVVGGALKLFKRMGGDKLVKAVEKGLDWGKAKVKAGKDWVKGTVKGGGGKTGRSDPSVGDDKTQDPPPDVAIVRNLSMGGESHTLTLIIHQGKLQSRIASSDPGELIAKLKARAQGLPKKSRAAQLERSALENIVEQYETDKRALDTLDDRASKGAVKRQMAERLAQELVGMIVAYAKQFNRHDFAKELFGVDEKLDAIKKQIEDQIEKHLTNESAVGNRRATGAAAAEVVLGWHAPRGERHVDKVSTASKIIIKALGELEELERAGLDLSKDDTYRRGKEIAAECEEALARPDLHLMKNGLVEPFVRNMRERNMPIHTSNANIRRLLEGIK